MANKKKKYLLFGKTALIEYVYRKLAHIISRDHIRGVIDILLEEMIQNLIAGKEIVIGNFCTIALIYRKPKLYHDVHTRQMKMSRSFRELRLYVDAKLNKLLIQHLDLDKTFPDG